MEYLRRIVLLLFLLGSSLPVLGQSLSDPTDEWLRQIEFQIRQNPETVDRLIRRLTMLRDPDLLERLHSKWNVHPFETMSADERMALFELDQWLAFRTNQYEDLLHRLQETIPPEVQAERKAQIATQLFERGEYSLARATWSDVRDDPLSVRRCPALAGMADSYLQEAHQQIRRADPDRPSPMNLLDRSDQVLNQWIEDPACSPATRGDLQLLFKLVYMRPTSAHRIHQISERIPESDPIRNFEEWALLNGLTRIDHRDWDRAEQHVNDSLDLDSGGNISGPARWYLALLNYLQGEPVGLETAYPATTNETTSFWDNDQMVDRVILDALSTRDRIPIAEFLIHPTLQPGLSESPGHAPFSSLAPHERARLLVRLHHRAGHLRPDGLLPAIEQALVSLDSSDPLVPELHWASLQLRAWSHAEGDASPDNRNRFNQLLTRFQEQFPGHHYTLTLPNRIEEAP